MGAILEILKNIPLTDSVKRHILDIEEHIAALEHKNTILEMENAEMGEALFEIYKYKKFCPSCKQPKGKFLKRGISVIFEQFKLIVNFYKCQNCDHIYE
jgi:rubredoxin